MKDEFHVWVLPIEKVEEQSGRVDNLEAGQILCMVISKDGRFFSGAIRRRLEEITIREPVLEIENYVKEDFEQSHWPSIVRAFKLGLLGTDREGNIPDWYPEEAKKWYRPKYIYTSRWEDLLDD